MGFSTQENISMLNSFLAIVAGSLVYMLVLTVRLIVLDGKKPGRF
jgi:hypothetical protein